MPTPFLKKFRLKSLMICSESSLGLPSLAFPHLRPRVIRGTPRCHPRVQAARSLPDCQPGPALPHCSERCCTAAGQILLRLLDQAQSQGEKRAFTIAKGRQVSLSCYFAVFLWQFPVTINTPCPIPAAVKSIMDYAINHGGQMPRHRHDKASLRQFASS